MPAARCFGGKRKERWLRARLSLFMCGTSDIVQGTPDIVQGTPKSGRLVRREGVGAVHGGGDQKSPRARSWRQAERETDFAADGLAISDGLFGLGFGGVVSRIADEHAKGCEPANRRIESHPQWLRGQEEVE